MRELQGAALGAAESSLEMSGAKMSSYRAFTVTPVQFTVNIISISTNRTVFTKYFFIIKLSHDEENRGAIIIRDS